MNVQHGTFRFEARMKTCRKCKETKPDSEFYKKSDNQDGLDRWCKICRYKDSQERYQKGARQLPWSTDKAIQMLSMNGIPTTVGRVVGRPGKDIVAYGYITIEAKSALPHRLNGYVFGLTKAQKDQHCDFYLLICRDTERSFVVPGNNEVLTLDGSAIYINVTDLRIQCFENAFHLIKQRALRDIVRSEPITSVRVLSGDRYYKIS